MGPHTLRFNSLLKACDIEPADVRLVRHKDTRSPAKKVGSIYGLWRDDLPAFETYQSRQTKEKHDKLLDAKFWASFVVTPAEETLFVGLYLVNGRQQLEQELACPLTGLINTPDKTWVYNLSRSESLGDLRSRMVIDWGSGERAWLQYASNLDKPIVEIRKEFQEPSFPGYQRFSMSLSEIAKMPRGWADALRSSRGVYVLTCPSSKEQYVGSACGSSGFFGRFEEYAQTGHGGNIALKERPVSDYRVAILEVAGSAASEIEILQMEELWKRKLQSREMGLNKN